MLLLTQGRIMFLIQGHLGKFKVNGKEKPMYVSVHLLYEEKLEVPSLHKDCLCPECVIKFGLR